MLSFNGPESIAATPESSRSATAFVSR